MGENLWFAHALLFFEFTAESDSFWYSLLTVLYTAFLWTWISQQCLNIYKIPFQRYTAPLFSPSTVTKRNTKNYICYCQFCLGYQIRQNSVLYTDKHQLLYSAKNISNTYSCRQSNTTILISHDQDFFCDKQTSDLNSAGQNTPKNMSPKSFPWHFKVAKKIKKFVC